MLAIMAAWRYVYKRFPLRYDPLYWGAVFHSGCTRHALFRWPRRCTLTSYLQFLGFSISLLAPGLPPSWGFAGNLAPKPDGSLRRAALLLETQ